MIPLYVVAGAFGDVGLVTFVAAFDDVGFSLFVAGAIF